MASECAQLICWCSDPFRGDDELYMHKTFQEKNIWLWTEPSTNTKTFRKKKKRYAHTWTPYKEEQIPQDWGQGISAKCSANHAHVSKLSIFTIWWGAYNEKVSSAALIAFGVLLTMKTVLSDFALCSQE